MQNLSKWLAKYKEYGPTILRLILGIVFIAHGWQKLQNIGAVAGFLGQVGIPAAGFFAYILTIVEFFGGILVLLGLFTRISALLISIEMIVALLTVKAQVSLLSGATGAGKELDLALLAIALALSLLGSGALSLEKTIFKKEW